MIFEQRVFLKEVNASLRYSRMYKTNNSKE